MPALGAKPNDNAARWNPRNRPDDGVGWAVRDPHARGLRRRSDQGGGPAPADLLRSLGLVPRTDHHWYNKSAYFNHNNRDKYALALDLADERGRNALLKLCAVSDVIVENFRSDVMDNLGLSYEAVKAANPNIIYISMPGHGKTGPEKDFVAYGSNVGTARGHCRDLRL